MNISELSIRRPVLATVLTIIILLFGLIGYTTLGVREYPSVDNPIISVTCSYPGANAEVIENQITEPLEQNIVGGCFQIHRQLKLYRNTALSLLAGTRQGADTGNTVDVLFQRFRNLVFNDFRICSRITAGH